MWLNPKYLAESVLKPSLSVSETHVTKPYTHMLPQCQVLSKILKKMEVTN